MYRLSLSYVKYIHLLVDTNWRMLSFFSCNVTLRTYGSNTKNYRFKKERFPKQLYDGFLLIDFESTCLTGYNTIKQHEIIEFPCIWVNGSDLKIVKTFHKFVRPVVHPDIDPFCTHLTGITNEMVENERTFKDVFIEFMVWYDDLKLSSNAKDTICVTDGNWDLDFMLPEQCRLSNMPIPSYMKHWVNLREAFFEVTGKYPKTLKEMLIFLNIKHEGRLHSGLDDSFNIYKIFRRLAEDGYVYS